MLPLRNRPKVRDQAHQVAVIDDPFVRVCGTDVETTMFGVIVPDHHRFPAPDDADPTEKCVSVGVPPVDTGKTMFATGCATLFVTAQPPDVRATAWRA